MKTWFSKNLGDATLAFVPLAQLEELLLSMQAGDSPEKFTVFTRHESEGRLHCEVKIYLPPSAIDVAKAIGAEPCEQPSPEGLSVLVGACLGEDQNN